MMGPGGGWVRKLGDFGYGGRCESLSDEGESVVRVCKIPGEGMQNKIGPRAKIVGIKKAQGVPLGRALY